MSEPGWQDIEIVQRATCREVGERVEIEWRLSARPGLEWAAIFQMADEARRSGTLEWVRGGSPDVLADAVRWFVPGDEVDDADAEVRRRLAVANERFRHGRGQPGGPPAAG